MEKLIEELHLRLFKIENYFAHTSENELIIKENSSKWSKKEILGHLIDSAQNNIRRIVVGQYSENENIVYDQDIWNKAADYQHYNTIDLVELFVLLNKHFCILLKTLPLENYKTLTNWGKTKPELVTLEYMAHDYLKHMDHHLNHMISKNYTEIFAEAK
jgi:hypothetical protein